MKIQGAVILIGSLFWEDEKNCIQLKSSKDLASKRKKWREDKLDIERRKLVELPIRYGRKSNSRYCTFTMLFSNSVKEFGKGYVVPYKEKINIKDNLDQMYCQAIELAQIEGISKAEENTLVKKWGSVGLFLNPKFVAKNKKIAKEITEFWEQHFKKRQIDLDIIDLYRIDETEKSSITKKGLLNFNISEESEDIDYYLATPTSPNVRSYPNGSDIAKAMNDTREEYYTYFEENFNNEIRTIDDEDIIKELPQKIKNRLKA